MTYSVKEIFYTLQGEGMQSGRAAVFCRFAGCNLWNGKEADRTNAICKFCDTDFVGTNGTYGGKYLNAEDLAQSIAKQWPLKKNNFYVVCTGGEPLLQLDQKLITALHALKFEIAIETNGTIAIPNNIDWVCVSPKSAAPILAKGGNELKIVIPQSWQNSDIFEKFEGMDFEYFLVQPMDQLSITKNQENVRLAIEHCKRHPRWRLSLQTHKLLGLR